MSLTDLAAIASIFSSVAVAISLAYLGVQAHQNAKHARAQIQSARVDRLMNQVIGYSDADKAAVYLKGNGIDPTPEAVQERQFMLLCLAQIAVMLDVFTQHTDGLLSDEQFAGVCLTYRGWLKQPGFRAQWQGFKNTGGHELPEFAAFVTSLAESPSPTSAGPAPAAAGT